MGDSMGPFIRGLAEARARNVADRVRKLVAAGVPYERLYLVSDPTCECAGLGIIVEQSEHAMRGYECPSCLGVGMVGASDAAAVGTDTTRVTL